MVIVYLDLDQAKAAVSGIYWGQCALKTWTERLQEDGSDYFHLKQRKWNWNCCVHKESMRHSPGLVKEALLSGASRFVMEENRLPGEV